MHAMFNYASSFNSDLSQWDVSKVPNMALMFERALSFNSDLTQWDVAKVTRMEYMFQDATEFKQDLCWNVPKSVVTTDMFKESSGSFGQVPGCIPVWIISGLSTDDHKWCLHPKTNTLEEGMDIVISKCDIWKSFKWTI